MLSFLFGCFAQAEQLAARTTRRKFRLLALCLHTLLPQNKTLDKGNVMLMMESNIGVSVCACACVRVRACVRACVCFETCT